MTVLFLTVFIDLVGFGIVLPLLPFFASHFQASGFMVTMLSSVFSLMQFVSAPLWGRLSDRIGRRPVLLISLAGSTLSYLALGFCTSFWQIFATRLMAGLFGGNIAVANAYIADITTPENRSRGMGLIGAAFGLGFVLGPGIGAIIIQLTQNPSHPERVYHVIGWVAAAICGLNFAVACGTLAESRSPQHSYSRSMAPMVGWRLWRRAFSNRTIAFLIILYFVLGFGFSNFESLFALFILGKFNYGIRQGTYFFLFLGLIVAMVQGGMIGYLVRSFGERRLIVFGSVLFAVSILLIPYTKRVWHLLVLLMGLGVGQGLNRSTIMGMISQEAGPEEQGGILGLAQSSGSLARILGPPLGGLLFDRVGFAIPFVTAGLLVLLTLIVGNRWIPRPGVQPVASQI